MVILSPLWVIRSTMRHPWTLLLAYTSAPRLKSSSTMMVPTVTLSEPSVIWNSPSTARAPTVSMSGYN
ncbi:unnamed protein product [Aureobasidium pullulans]|nr:unnamed protein product [Aureobasidium pullulans]